MNTPRTRLWVASLVLASLVACAGELAPLPTVDDDADVDAADASADTDTGADDTPTLDPCLGVSCRPDEVCQNGFCVPADVDADGDGHPSATDCNELDATVHPGAVEACDGIDNDCDDQVDEGFDADGDTWAICATARGPSDCDDGAPDVHPASPELCDGIDNNCDQAIDEGADGDGDGAPACHADPAQVDCDDLDPSVFPAATELCDGIDNDCNGQIDEGSACVGCSDGARDELTDLTTWPTVAACKGEFGRGSLRRERTHTACGDDLGAALCPAPEDLCAEGWHICMRNGLSTDLRFRLTAAECRALPEIYVAATNNCSNPADVSPATTGCDTTEPYGCYETGWCSAPVACGPTETSHCAHAAWPNATRIFGLHAGRTEDNGCGNISSDTAYASQGKLAGVLCCLD